MSDYRGTVSYWDKVFKEASLKLDIDKPLSFAEIEKGLHWVCRDSKNIMDFGCGSGKVLFRCLGLGAEKVLGIDISPNAVSIAERIVTNNGLTGSAEFAEGSLSILKGISDQSYDAAILFNVVDNMIPEDARELISEMKRIVRPKGKIFMKLNDYYPDSFFRDNRGYEMVGSDFYHEKSGLFLWNLSEKAVEELVGPQFEIEWSSRIEFKEYKIWNRIYYLRRRP